MKRIRLVAVALTLILVGGLAGFRASEAASGNTPPPPAGPLQRAYWRMLGIRTAPLRIRVKDALTLQGIPGAGCIIGETRQRVETDEKGIAPVIQAPIFRHPRLEEMLAELHGALTVLCYKNGYRDQVYMGLRMYDGIMNEPEIWMYPIGSGDRRVEPQLYQAPVHRLWLIRLTDKYRLFEEGEGPERPGLTRPEVVQPAPQEELGGYIQTPIRPAPPQPEFRRVPEREVEPPVAPRVPQR